MVHNLLQFGGEIPSRKSKIIGMIGAMVLLLLWYLATYSGNFISPGILPSPKRVITSFPELLKNYNLIGNMFYTVKLNWVGYFKAIVIGLPLGFIIGCFPICRALFQKYLEAFRYLPLPTVSGIFIAIFGLEFGMKSWFLGFGILIFLLPSIVQKILDLQNPSNIKDYVYVQTGKTLGMTDWQMFRYIYIPYVMEKTYDDIRSLVAISYTYVVIAESLNKVGGIGAMISTFTRQSRMPEIYALLFVIVLIGILQDYLFKIFKPILFPYTKK